MDYNTLLEEALKNSINVKELDLKARDGLCYGNRIAISKRLKTNKEKYCVLAEELGHHYLTVGDITNQKEINNRKQEYKARRWAYEKLVGIVSIINAFEKGIRTKYDLSEYLNITEQFLDEAIKHYKEKYGLYYEIDNYLVYFEPSLAICKMF